MRHLVFCRAVADLENLSVSQGQGRVFEKGKRRLDPVDERAIEAARQAGGEVVAMVAGDEADQDALRKAFAMGVERGVFVRVTGDGFVVANAVRAAARLLDCGKIWFGEPHEVALRVGGEVAAASIVPRAPNALAIMKAAKKSVETLDVGLSGDEAAPRVVLRSEYLA
jgi:electron transfer flavoprotein alpha/beta subunit